MTQSIRPSHSLPPTGTSARPTTDASPAGAVQRSSLRGQDLATQMDAVTPAAAPVSGGGANMAHLDRVQRAFGAEGDAAEQAGGAPVQKKGVAVQMDGDKDKAKPAPPPPEPAPKKEILDADAALKILTDAFGAYKAMSKGNVMVLEQAAFQTAYDKIYGATEWSWAKHVAPGNLEGFRYGNDMYINKDCTSLDTVPHEMLHANAAADWKGTVGSEFNEGTTEYLTIKAVTKAGKTPTHSYPAQEGCVKELMAQGLSEATLMTAYFKGDAATLICKWADTSCTDTWANIMAALQANNWATAKAKMKKKTK